MTVVSLLVYPLHLGASPLPPTTMNGNGGVKNTPPSWPSITPVGAAAVATAAIIVAVPSIFIWAVAVWGAGRFHWGFASGVCVGLQSAGLTLKTWSFVHKCYPAAVGWGSPTVAKGFRELSSSPDASYFADGNERPAGSGNANTVAPAGQDPCDGATATPSPRSEYKRSPDLERVATLTFEEFAFFILFAPSLVCEPRLLKRRARRPVDARSVASAASEFFHAGLTYLAVHVYSSALFAPTLRVIAVALHSSWEDVHVWADASGWAALGAEEGSGEWLLGMFRPAAADGDAGEFFTTFAVEGGGGGGSEQQLMVGWTVAAAACFGTFVFSPMMHFLMFYAFWHCVCLGSAELWGYPDRNTYGERSEILYRAHVWAFGDLLHPSVCLPLCCTCFLGGGCHPSGSSCFSPGSPAYKLSFRVPVSSSPLLVVGQVVFLPFAVKHHTYKNILSWMFDKIAPRAARIDH